MGEINFCGWKIIKSDSYYVEYEYYHEDHNGPEMNLGGHGESVESCIEEIIEIYYQPKEGW